MRIKVLFLGIFILVSSTTYTQPGKGQLDLSKVPVPKWHYQPEYSFDKSADTVLWAKQTSGLHAAFGTTDELYFRSEVPFANRGSLTWEQTGWRGERLNAQILVWSSDTVEQIRFYVSDIVDKQGKTISKNCIKLNLVRYIVSNYFYGASNSGCEATIDSAWLMPDRFETFDRFDLPGRTVRPVWITFDIPGISEPGEYSGNIKINSLNDQVNLKVNLTIQEQLLPDPQDWKFRLDLWQNPWVIARYFNLEPWSTEHKALLKKHLKLYADTGGKYITTYAVHSPWSDNSYTIEGTMIEWIKTSGGLWKFDYSIFDQYVELATEAGINGAITIYTPLPWGNRFRYMDEKSGNYVYEEWPPASTQFRTFWNPFLDDLKMHLIEKGWFKKTYLGINENPLEYTIAAVKIIKEHSKDWRITYAGDWHQELSSLLDDYSVIITNEPQPDEMKQRSAKGFTTTFYVCCTPPKPNNFVFSPPVEGRYISWYAAAYGYDGFLRWAYDAWPADPVRDARHTFWPAGDCFIVYPGANSCIRFEKLREGIVDYEKILILRKLVSKSSNKGAIKKMMELETYLKTLIIERDYSKRDFNAANLTEALKKGNTLIRELSIELGH